MRLFASTPDIRAMRLGGCTRFLALALMFSLGMPLVAFSAEKPALPAGFVALSDKRMTWAEAEAYCRQQGGRLPRIGGMAKWDGADPPRAGIAIDGFGAIAAPWPSGLPDDRYWTDTATVRNSESWWYIFNVVGLAGIRNAFQGAAHGVACVP